jgi:hypothetical protein
LCLLMNCVRLFHLFVWLSFHNFHAISRFCLRHFKKANISFFYDLSMISYFYNKYYQLFINVSSSLFFALQFIIFQIELETRNNKDETKGRYWNFSIIVSKNVQIYNKSNRKTILFSINKKLVSKFLYFLLIFDTNCKASLGPNRLLIGERIKTRGEKTKQKK